ncbi:efflux RND transporter periplasmic adaptor subunit [Marinomonas sp.]
MKKMNLLGSTILLASFNLYAQQDLVLEALLLTTNNEVISDGYVVSPSLPSKPFAARGVIQAKQQATLASGIGAKVEQFNYRQGQGFEKGAVLVKFDCRGPLAEIKASQADVYMHKQKVAVNEEMAKFDSISDYEVLLTKTELSKAEAELEARQIELDACEIKAPFSGRVVETLVNRHEVVAKNDPLLAIVDAKQLEVSIIIPSTWLQWLETDHVIQFKVDELATQVEAKVIRISPVVDPVSKTIAITAVFNGKAKELKNLLPGMSGTAIFTYTGSAI